MTGEVVVRGTRFPRRATGRVFSVHDGAINITIDGRPDLTALVVDPTDMTVASLCIRPTTAGSRSIMPSIVRGESVTIGPTRIAIGSVAIDLTGDLPAPFAGKIAPVGADTGQRIAAVIPVLLAAIATESEGAGFSPIARALAMPHPFTRPLPDASVFATAAWETLRRADDTVPAELIGLGEGFTPSGDDFVAGWLAAARLLGGSFPGAEGAAAVHARLPATTLPGSSLLIHAVDGCFPAYLCRFVESFVATIGVSPGEATRRVGAAVEQASAHGASSGVDALTGFAYGLHRTLMPT